MRPDPKRYVKAICSSGLTIYDPIQIGDPNLWIPTPELEQILDTSLRGTNLGGVALRTRSRLLKEKVCAALGYPIPKSFKKTRPRFPGQMFDTYGQKANNLQVWNDELAPTRRYVIVRVDENGIVAKVKVVTGDTLALLDTTGTLTQKYQARFTIGGEVAELVVERDTNILRPHVSDAAQLKSGVTPIDHPQEGQLLPIREAFNRLKALIGDTFPDPGHDQERLRGATLHKLVCRSLGYSGYQDDGQFPDVRHQLLEVKLQTSPTIDLGLVTPASTEPVDVPQIQGRIIRHCDIRYAVFYGKTDGAKVSLTHLVVTTGESFFTRFPQFEGKVLNKKLQIPLPRDFFD